MAVSTASLIGGATTVIAGSVAIFAWRKRTDRVALPFMALAITLAVWSLIYGIQLGFGTLRAQLVWQRFTLSVAGFVPTMWLLFVLAYTGRDDWLRRDRLFLLLSEPLAFLVLCLTNPSHELVFSEATLTSTPIGDVPALQFGAGYDIHIIYAYALVAGGIGLLFLYGTQIAPTYQKQVALLITAATPPFLTHVAFTLGMSPIPFLDLTPFVFAFTGVVLGLALFRFNLLRLAPIARMQSLTEVGDGLVVLNRDREIVDIFGVTTEVLDPVPHVGDPFSTAFPDVGLRELDGSEVTKNIDGHRHVYQFQVSPLTGPQDRQVGTTITIRDITGLHESKQRLSVTNRVLRHNLRNDMTVVLGHAQRLESNLERPDADAARSIRETAEGFLELSEKARQITRLYDEAGDKAVSVDAVPLIGDIVAEFRSEHPSTSIKADVPDEAIIEVFDSDALRLAVRNVLDNAITHNDAATPEVAVCVERNADALRIEIADNGPGIPQIERDVLESKAETSLEHSQGLGLWLTYWCVALWGGEFHIDADANGSTVTMTVPWTRGGGTDSSLAGPANY